MGFEEFNKFRKNIDKMITQESSSYNLSKERIIQDESTKINEQPLQENIPWYKKIDWSSAGHNTANVLLVVLKIIKQIVKFFPLILLFYPIIQIGLYISKWILPFTPWLDKGWNDTFISKLPYIFQPIGHPWACFSLILTSLVILCILNEVFLKYAWTEKDNTPTWMYLIVNIPVLGFLYCIFGIPELTIKYVGWVGIIATLIILGLKDNISGGSSGGYSGGGSSGGSYSYDEDDEDDYEERPKAKSYSKSSHVEESQPVIKTLKIVNARQIAHNVNYKVNEFENGKDTGRGSIHGKTGMLQNWNESSVTVKDGKWFRQYGLHGEIINSWRDPLNEK